ncbi:MAG: tyrosine-type recombinase/integrase [Gemmataceae bacterium]|nr:tyrosine-type recombinase/integrase [Gemmataceae bacterium]
MPRKSEMSWEPKPAFRWRKMFKGTMYRVSCAELGLPENQWTELDSVALANEWWRKRVSEISPTLPSPKKNEENVVVADLGFAEIAVPKSQAKSQQKKAEGLVADLLDELTDKPAAAFQIQTNIDRWIEVQLAEGLTPGRIAVNKHMLGFFAECLGKETDARKINENAWEQFYLFVLGRKEWKDNYRARIMATARSFLKRLYAKRVIDVLPRNLDENRIKKTVGKIKTVPTEDVKTFFKAAHGQTRLHVLLALNCGMNPKDIATLRQTEVDWTAGTITRKRSKTQDHDDVPEVTYSLWAETFRLLKKERSKEGEFVLLTKTGKPWIVDKLEGDKYCNSNSIASCYRWTSERAKVRITPKLLRATASTMLGSHASYKFYSQYFLGHSPRTIADKHYVVPNDSEFAEALRWLGKQFGVK